MDYNNYTIIEFIVNFKNFKEYAFGVLKRKIIKLGKSISGIVTKVILATGF